MIDPELKILAQTLSASNDAGAFTGYKFKRRGKNAKESFAVRRNYVNEFNCAWVEKYMPLSFSELAVHNKKVQEVEAWIDGFWNNHCHQNILLLTGPPGAAKSATLHLLCKVNGISVIEWANRLSKSNSEFCNLPSASGRTTNDFDYQETEAAQFKNFLLRCERYPMLNFSDAPSRTADETVRKLILLDDLPNFCFRERVAFHDVLRRFRRTSTFPLVIIISSTNTSPDASERRIFPDNILAELQISKITFNAIAQTLVIKALRRIVDNEQNGTPHVEGSEDLIQRVVASCNGDIRHAINELQFILSNDSLISQEYCGSAAYQGIATKLRKRHGGLNLGSENEPTAKKSCGAVLPKEPNLVSLDLFHALGKILHSKRDDKRPVNSDHRLVPALYRQKFLLADEPENIIQRSHVDANTVNTFLHENYGDFYRHSDSMPLLAECANIFSISDMMLSDWTASNEVDGKSIAAGLAARAVVHFNGLAKQLFDEAGSKGGLWRPLRKPKWISSSRQAVQDLQKGVNLFLPVTWNTSAENFIDLMSAFVRLPTIHLQNEDQCKFLSNTIQLPHSGHWTGAATHNFLEPNDDLSDVYQESLQCISYAPSYSSTQFMNSGADQNVEEDDDIIIEEFDES